MILASVALGLFLSGFGGPQTAPAAPAASADQPQPAWKADFDRRRAELAQINGSGTDAELRDELTAMLAIDQQAHGLGHGQAEGKGSVAEISAQLTTQLKGIVAKSGWPTIALVGIDASNAAIVILTHTGDHAWQASLLPELETLADTKKIDGSALAPVIDRELLSEGKLQRYGTQFKNVDGELAMYGVEDPGGLDARRARVLLPPMDYYKQTLSQMYHLKIGNKIVSAAK